MKLATWNLALPVAAERREAARAWTKEIDADLWVLTETHDGFSPGLPISFSFSSTEGRDGRHRDGHRWVTIWSRHPLTLLPTTDPIRTVAVRVAPEKGAAFVVFGSVLPWIGSPWQNWPAAGGVAFAKALEVQAGDWQRLRQEYPDDEFFVMGDLNQDLVQPRYYGSVANRQALLSALDGCGLVPLTGGENDPVRRDSPPCACIDHICARRDSQWRAESTVRWPDTPKPDRWLSDHFGIAVNLVPNVAP